MRLEEYLGLRWVDVGFVEGHGLSKTRGGVPHKGRWLVLH
jgi:hypothetical protein